MKHVSFQDEITRNKRNTIFLVILVSSFLLFMIYFFTYILAPSSMFIVLPISGVFILLYVYSSYRYGDKVILSSTKAVPPEGRDKQYLQDTVEGLSIAAGIPSPKIFVMKTDELNAYATGRNPENASVVVTTGLLKALNRQELEGVIAHELSHIKNRDILIMTLIAVVVGLAAILSHMFLRSILYGGFSGRSKDRNGGIEIILIVAGFILAIIAPLAVRVIQFAVSRRREYLADASGAELTRYPEGLASALEKISKNNKRNIDVSEAVSHIFLDDPKHSSLDGLFSTHPPLEERIRLLRAM